MWYTRVSYRGILPTPVQYSPVAKFLIFRRNQKLGHMEQSVIYPHKNAFKGGLAILTIREHLCGYFQLWTRCVEAGSRLDPSTGHRVCCGCDRITVASGLRRCDMCEREYINLKKHQDNSYETYCPACVERYGLDDD